MWVHVCVGDIPVFAEDLFSVGESNGDGFNLSLLFEIMFLGGRVAHGQFYNKYS